MSEQIVVLSTLQNIIHQLFVGYKEDKQTHKSMCVLAANWLIRFHKCRSVLVERGGAGGEMPDVLGFYFDDSFVIEAKQSRGDFLSDAKKPHRINPESGMGKYRYYICPKDLIKPEEIPENWGLLYVTKGGMIKRIKGAKAFQEFNRNSEFIMLTSALATPWKLFAHWSDELVERVSRINWMSDYTKYDVHHFCARVAASRIEDEEKLHMKHRGVGE